jgi:thioredoxin reductase (NADPH)
MSSDTTGGKPRSVPPQPPGSTPTFTAGDIERLSAYGQTTDVAVGDLIFADGEANYDLVIVLEGRLEVVENIGRPDEAIISTYGPGQFPGEISLLTGQRAFLTAIMREPGRALRIRAQNVHTIIEQEPDLSEVLLRALLARHARLTEHGAGLTLIGSRFHPDTRRLLSILARNRLSSRWLDVDSPGIAEVLAGLDITQEDLPVVLVPGREMMRNPTAGALVDALGLSGRAPGSPEVMCDVVIVGGGPAGMAAAVYAASEGLTTTLVESDSLGGQAGTSSRIENLLGFPAGISGEELTARAQLQARKFGARILVSCRATGLEVGSEAHIVRLETGDTVSGRTIIAASGVRHNGLPLERIDEFAGVGVYYAATQMEAQACAGEYVAIVGGGNSAGQAALFLSRHCARVHILIRKPDLSSSMSWYLIDQIQRTANITISGRTEVSALDGESALECLQITRGGQRREELAVQGLFLFTGAKPNTAWLSTCLATDDHGFVLTGDAVPRDDLEDGLVAPLPLESSRPGVFCVGDARSGSTKRAATAIGEGSMAVRLVFERLAA